MVLKERKNLKRLLSKYKIIIIFCGLTICVLAISGIYQSWRKNYDQRMLNQGSVRTWAIYFADREGKGITGTKFYFFNSNGKRMEFERTEYCSQIEIGDTITIEYAKKDNSCVRIVSFR